MPSSAMTTMTGGCEVAYESQVLPVPENSLQVIIKQGNKLYSSSQPLGEVFAKSDGPQSLESGCMFAVREICQQIWQEIQERK